MIQILNWRAGLLLLCLLLLFSVASASDDLPETDNSVNHTRTLVAYYVIGSDLETDDNDATEGIEQFIKGYGETSPRNLSFIMAYGGSKKPGWEGMTIESIQQLQSDMSDGAVGNDQIYEFRNPDANMGSAETLETFLTWVNEHYQADTRYLFFSDHGAGWGGFGSDENHDGSGLLLSDISGALDKTEFNPNLTGFDACLMGAIEVAHSLSPHTPLLVGSEETEPGAGWRNDKWIEILAKDPAIDPAVVGKSIVDTYIDETDSQKTLSLIDTSKTGALVASLSDFSGTVSGDDQEVLRQFASAYRDLKGFGSSSDSVDLIDLSRSLGGAFPASSGQAEVIGQKAKDLVIYERHTPDMGFANGISILSPDNKTAEDIASAGEGIKLVPGWDSAFLSLLNFLSGSAELIGLHKTEEGMYELTDPTGYAMVQTAYFRMNGNEPEIIGTLPLESDDSGKYIVPAWDGRWFQIVGEDDARLTPSFMTVEAYEDGSIFLSAPVTVNKKDANLEIVVKGDVVESTEIAPYTTNPEGETTFGNTYLPENGDIIGITSGESEQSITWSPETAVRYETLPDGAYATGLYLDQVTGSANFVVDRNITISQGVAG